MADQHPEGLLHRGHFRNLSGNSSAESKMPESYQDSGINPNRVPLETFNFESHKGRWLELLKLVNDEFPYCTMYGVHVVDGSITACEQIQRSLMFGNDSKGSSDVKPEMFDMKWQALEALCLNIGTGRLVELKFHDAKPVIAITKEGGRRFKGILKKLSRA
jgi:hypothetical protein